MKKVIICLWLVSALTLGFLFTGCGSSDKTYTTIESNITEPYDVPGGTAIIVDGSEGATVSQENQTITIDCGGTCGNITVGVPVENK